MVDKIPIQHPIAHSAKVRGIYPAAVPGRKDPQKENMEEEWVPESGRSLGTDKLPDIVDALNNFLEPNYTSLKFELHENLDEYYVVVIDDKTKEVIREIPPKKLLDMYAAIAEYIGLIIDERI